MSSYDYYATVHKRYVFGFSKGKFPTGIKDQFTAIEIEDDGRCRRIGFHGEADQELTRLEDIEDALDYISPNNDIDMLNPDIVIVLGQVDRKYVDRMLKNLRECPRVSLVYFENVLPYLLLNKRIDVVDTLDVCFYQNFYRVTLQEDDSLKIAAVESVGDDAVTLKGPDFVCLLQYPNLSAGAKQEEIERIKLEASEEVESIRQKCQEEVENLQAKQERRQYLPYGLEKTIKFGQWSPEAQRSPNRDLEWYVLAVEKDAKKGINRALLLSKYALCKRRFDENSAIWRTSELRTWLNDQFIKRAFNEEEQARLVMVFDGEPFEDYEAAGGYMGWIDDWKDRVFLLSLSECLRILRVPTNLQCEIWEASEKEPSGSCWWWLRSACSFGVDYVFSGGGVCGRSSCNYDGGAVRPALWVKI